MADSLQAQKGSRETAKELSIGYFAQHQLEQLHDELSPIQHLKMVDADISEKEARQFLGGFDFQGDMALAAVAPFSGGEKARLVLALLVYQQPNLLLLDEPTNHLDLEMRHALSVALQSFEGAMVLVSHDRHLLRTVCDSLMLVSHGVVDHFNGDLDDYSAWLLQQRDALDLEPVNTSSRPSKKDIRREKADKRKALQPLRNKVKKLESELEQLQQQQAALDISLADPCLYEQTSSHELRKLTMQHHDLHQRIETVEESWMSASEQLECADD
jgi:ATP-binding cassette subfamily F protein 3